MKKLPFLHYLFTIGITSIIFVTIYIGVQQNYRSGANDPQVKFANDINEKLQQGKDVESLFKDSVDIAKSLSPFVVLFNNNGKPIRSTGFLDDSMIDLPPGVFDFTKSHGEHRVTWQPRPGIRMAMVIVSSNASQVGFVASGRSLREVEQREQNLVTIIFFGWIGCIALILLQALLQFYKISKSKTKVE